MEDWEDNLTNILNAQKDPIGSRCINIIKSYPQYLLVKITLNDMSS